MLAEIAILAVTQTATRQVANVQIPQAVSTVQELDRHKRHLLHMAHERYLAWQRREEAIADSRGEDSPHVTVTAAHFAPGIYSCHALEVLWQAAGGRSDVAYLAAEIAEAESGGRSWAISPTNDYGLWQINGSHGYLATLDPYGNARAAVLISDNGSDWFPWTTYTSGAYIGRCLGRCRLTSYVVSARS